MNKHRTLVANIVNGQLVASNKPLVSACDQGLLCGYGLFETMRVYGGRVSALEAHLHRLLSSCSQLGMSSGLSLHDLTQAVRDYVDANRVEHGAIRLTLTRGDTRQGVAPALVITYRELTYLAEHYEQGFSTMVSPIRKNPTSPLVYHKTLNYLENLLALEEARRLGAQEALFLNTGGWLTEGSISNLFFVRDRVIHTPAVTCGLLAGITRQAVIDLARTREFQVTEGEYTLEHLLDAGEAFLTNSLMELMPLVKVNGQPVGSGAPGPVTAELLAGYRGLLAVVR